MEVLGLERESFNLYFLTLFVVWKVAALIRDGSADSDGP